MQSQDAFEVAARVRLMDELMADGISVALPVRAGVIDMLASIGSPTMGRSSAWIPVSVAVISAGTLANRLATMRVPGLLVVMIWSLGSSEAARTFAFTPAELKVIKMITCIGRNSVNGDPPVSIAAGMADRILKLALKPFAIFPGQWRQRMITALASASITGSPPAGIA